MAHSKAVTIVGAGALTGAGRGVEPFWQALCRAEPNQQVADLGDPRMQPKIVSIPAPRRPEGELSATWLRIACEDALEQATPAFAGRAPRLALLCGTSLGGMTIFEAHHRSTTRPQPVGPGMPTTAVPAWQAFYDGPAAALAARFSFSHGGWTLNTACSSAANAMGIARLWLQRGHIDAALVAGVDVISPFVFAGFQALGAIDPEPLSPFAAERRGLNLGDAAVAFVLMRSDEAPAQPKPIQLLGFGSSGDAFHVTRPDPQGTGLARALRASLKDAGVEPGAVGLISAHATGTLFNDSMEAAAFASIWPQVPPIHCAKPIFGHTLGSAGVVDALAVSLMLQHEWLPATYLRGSEDAQLPCHPTREAGPLAANTLAVSTSSGFGGSNAALVFGRGDR